MCVSRSGVVDALKIVTCLGDANERVEAHSGTTNAAPDREKWLLIWKKIGK